MSTSRAPKAARTNYHHGDLRNALLATARELIAEQGVDGFRLREVSRRAGVSHTAFYNHFADKASLVEALVIEAFGTLTSAMRAAKTSQRDSLERLKAAGVAYVCFAHEHRTEFRFMFRPEHCATPANEDSPLLREAGEAAYRVLVDAVTDCLRDGAITGDPETLVLTAWAGVHGLAALLVDGPQRDAKLEPFRVEALATAVTGMLVRGMQPRPAA